MVPVSRRYVISSSMWRTCTAEGLVVGLPGCALASSDDLIDFLSGNKRGVSLSDLSDEFSHQHQLILPAQ